MARISRDPDDTPIAQKILAAAIRQFGKAGFEASLQDIAKDAGVTAAGVYYHYTDKRELLFRCLEWMASSLYEACKPAESIPEPDRALKFFVSTYIIYQVRQFAQIAPMYASLVHGTRHQQHRLSAKQQKALRELEHRTLDLLRKIIQSGRTQRSFKIDNPKLAAFAIIGMAEHTLNWVDPAGELDVTSIAKHYAELALRLVGASEKA